MTKIKQISIFLENKSGRLSKVTQTLEDAHVNIHALSLADTSDFGILRLIVSDTTKARETLQFAGFTAGLTDVLAIKMPHAPGGLNSVLQLFSAGGVNIEYMYAFAHKDNDAVLVLRCQNDDEAIQILTQHGITLMNDELMHQI